MQWVRSRSGDETALAPLDPSQQEPEERPRAARRPLLARLLPACLAALAVGAGVMFMAASDAAMSPAPAAPPPPARAWVDIVRPIALYSLDIPDLARLDSAYEARRHEPGGGRRDTLAFGRLGATAYLRLSAYRLGEEAEPAASLFVEAARRAGEIGYAVTRLGAADATPTRFGAMETADVTLARGAGEAHCLAFRLIPQDGAEVMRLSGLSCGAPAQPIDRAALACQIDRLDLRSAGDDAALRRLFVQAERRRDGACAPSRLARAGWLEPAGAAPTLRGAANDADPAPTKAIPAKKRKAARAR